MGCFIEITANNWVDDGQMVNIVIVPAYNFYDILYKYIGNVLV
jgi:hypothetical protein